MLAFVIPFKPYRNSKNWVSDSNYLRNTIQSILQQSEAKFHVFVIVHDLPQDLLINEKITYLTLPKDYCVYDLIVDGADQLKGNTYLCEKDVEYLFDQGKKQMYGAKIAVEMGFEFIMSVDADDLISKNLVKYVMDHKAEGNIGWFVDKGYYFLQEKNIFIKRPYAMNMYNGSTNIVHKDYIPAFDINSMKLGDINFYSSHAYLVFRLKELFGSTLKPLPFYAIIYVVTNENWRISIGILKGKSIVHFIKYLLRKVYFKKRIEKDFFIKINTEYSLLNTRFTQLKSIIK